MHHQIVVPGKLERTADDLYNHLSQGESDLVKDITSTVVDYMTWVDRGRFIVAGVGSILRYADPAKAKDIDIVVVGLKYFQDGPRHRNGKSPRVKLIQSAESEFTATVATYIDALESHFQQQGYVRQQPRRTYSSPPPWPSIKLEHDDTITLLPLMEKFSHYGSKSVVVRASGRRPVHVHFVFNKTVREWRTGQGRLDEPGNKHRPDKSKNFYYAVLHEQR